MIVVAPHELRPTLEVLGRLSDAWGLEAVTHRVEHAHPDVEVVVDPAALAGLDEPGGRDPRPVPADERHVVDRQDGRLVVRVAGPEGAFRALVELLRPGTDPGPSIVPAWRWRGLSLDVARHFHPVAEVEAVIDLLAFHHLNVLHLHLTDSQAWRLESPRWPRLVAETGDQHYSRADLAALVAYAADRFVTVVPEIDLPGHVLAALRAYPELEEGYPPPHPALGHLCPNIPAAVRFVEDMVDELVEVSPSAYVHVGGDEAFGMDPEEYAEMVRLSHGRVRAHGRLPVAWQEASRGEAGPDQVLQWWISPADVPTRAQVEGIVPPDLRHLLPLLAQTFHESPADVPRALAGGSPLLLSPSEPCYLDRRYAEPSLDPAQDERLAVLGHPGYPPRTVRAVQEWHPGRLDPVRDGAADVVGVEAAIWAETIRSFDDLALLLLPRLSAIADVAWRGRPRPWPDWAAQARRDAAVWEALGFTDHFRFADPHPADAPADPRTTR